MDGVRLSEDEIDYLTSLIVERNKITDATAVLNYKENKIKEMLKAYHKDVPISEAALAGANSMINWIVNKYNAITTEYSSIEIPDGKGTEVGSKAKNNLKSDIKNFFGLRPSNSLNHKNNLPYTLRY